MENENRLIYPLIFVLLCILIGLKIYNSNLKEETIEPLKKAYVVYYDMDNPFVQGWRAKVEVINQLENKDGELWIQFNEVTPRDTFTIEMSEESFRYYLNN